LKPKKLWGGFLSALILLLSSSGRNYLFSPPVIDVSKWKAFWCRARGHDSVIWYSNANKPDMRCMGCFDDLG
jgi:hypothetical protein